MINVYFRVVGLYFGSNPKTKNVEGDDTSNHDEESDEESDNHKNVTGEIEVEVPADPTAKQVTKAAERKANDGLIDGVVAANFDFQKGFLKKASVTYVQRPKDERFTEEDDRYPDIETFFPLPRKLTLEDKTTEEDSPLLAWQYYVQDVDRRPDPNLDSDRDSAELNQENTDNDFIPATHQQPERSGIDDGDMLTWRLVAIQNVPKIAPSFLPDPIIEHHADIIDDLLDDVYRVPRVNLPLNFEDFRDHSRNLDDPQLDDLESTLDDLPDMDKEAFFQALQPTKDTTFADHFDQEGPEDEDN